MRLLPAFCISRVVCFLCTLTAASLLPAEDLRGLLVDPDRAAVSGAWITLYSASGSDVRKSRTGHQGDFLFSGVAPGSYFLEAEAPGFSAAPKQIDVRTLQTEKVEIVLTLPVVSNHVVVTSSSTPLSVDSSAKALDSIDYAGMKDRAEFSLAEVLRQIPGIRVQQLGGPGSFTRVHTRGLRAFDTSVLIDGFRLRDTGAPQGDATGFLSDLMVVNPASVEVLRGSGSSLYGTHAMAGVINLITDQGGGPTHGEFSLEGGGLGLFRGLARVGGSAANQRIQYSAGLAHLNVSSGVDGDDRTRNSSAQAAVQFLLAPKSRLSTRFFGSNAFAGLNSSPFAGPTANLPTRGLIPMIPLPGDQAALATAGMPFSWGNATYAPALNDPDNRRLARQYLGLIGFSQELNSRTTLRLNYHVLNSSRDTRDGPGGVRFPPLFNNSTVYDGAIHNAQARVDTALGRIHLISAGYEFEDENYTNVASDANPNPAARLFARTQIRERSHSVFAQDQVRLFSNRLLISVSGRWQGFSLQAPTFEGGAPQYTQAQLTTPADAYTGDVSIAYLFPGPGTKLRAHTGNAYRAPALYERFGTSFFGGSFFAYGDPRLSPERAFSMDAGIDQYFLNSKLKLSGTYFYSKLQRVIAFGTLLGRDPFDRFSGYLNTAGGIARGVEFSGEAAVARHTRIRGSYTYTRAQEHTPLFADGLLYSVRVPKNMGTMMVTQSLTKRLDATLDMSILGESITPLFAGTGTRAFVSPGYQKADVALTYTIPVNDRVSVQAFTRIDNILNRRIYEDGFRIPGIWAVGGLRILF